MIPHDLAASLTSSLLNQPMPLQPQPSKTPVLNQEIRSRKENRALHRSNRSPSTMSSASTSGRDHHEMRKVSQELHIGTNTKVSPEIIMSRGNSPCEQRISSFGDFGIDIINTTGQGQPLETPPGSALDTASKRIRNFTPASARVIDEEDEPRRPSPRARLSAFMDDSNEGT